MLNRFLVYFEPKPLMLILILLIDFEPPSVGGRCVERKELAASMRGMDGCEALSRGSYCRKSTNMHDVMLEKQSMFNLVDSRKANQLSIQINNDVGNAAVDL